MNLHNADRMTAFSPDSAECRECGATVELTYINGQVQETDGYGFIICERCWNSQTS